MTARYLSNLAAVLSPEGIIPAAKGGTGTTTGGSSGGPKISLVTVTDSSYNVLDDTAVNITGGYIKITGSGFASGCQVLVNTTAATSVTFISATEVRAQLPATAAGTYIIYLVNSDGDTAIRVNGVNFSTTPTWTTASTLAGLVNSAISIQLAATGATTFTLASGSTLPSGVSLSSSGLLTGTVTGISTETTYNFTVNATDSELQDSPRTFAFTVTAGDTYFKYNTLLLSANGTNAAQNNTFVDSSTNNFGITRYGNTTQGTFSPYGPNWSIYQSDVVTSYLNFTTGVGSTFQFTGDFTIEAWVYYPSLSNATSLYVSSDASTYFAFNISMFAGVYDIYLNSGSPTSSFSHGISVNTWTHVAMVRSGSTVTLYTNGVSKGTITNSATLSYSAPSINRIGGGAPGGTERYTSNFRVVKGTAVYTGAFTPPTTPLTAISGTSILTCQSNRFIDNSTNAFAITTSGSPTIQRFSPFSTAYSTSTIGGSGYFDGSGDYLTAPNNAAFNFGTGNFTVECWVYVKSFTGSTNVIISTYQDGSNGWTIGIVNNVFYGSVAGDSVEIYSSVTPPVNTWTHLALTRSSTTLSLFVNGVVAATQSNSTNMSTASALTIGTNVGGGSLNFTGYITDVRVVKGTALYTSAFTPPTAPVTAISGTSLLTNFTNAAIVDNAMQNNIETVGNAQISTTQSKFGGSSMSFDGTGDYCFLPKTDAFNFGSGDFTIELWSYISETSNRKYILGPGTVSATHISGFGLEIWGQQLSLWMSSTGTSWNMIESDTASNRGATLMAANTWYHIAVTRSGNTVRAFINGVLEKTFTVSGAVFFDPNIPYNIGRSGYDPAGYFHYNGYMDDLRVTRGIARYTSTFTPPQTALLTQ